MTNTLTKEQRTGALIAALDWVGAYEGNGGTIVSGATDVPQDLLDAFVLLSDMVRDAIRDENRAVLLAEIEATYPNAVPARARAAATRLARENLPIVRHARILSTDSD
jgi:hypothetical protein